MEIDINQKKVSISDNYSIFIEGQPTYTASKKLFHFLPEIVILSGNEDTPRITINKKFSWFLPKYDITLRDNTVLQFRPKSKWKILYQCRCGSDTYDIYGNKGRKYSIYKNDIQVAWWSNEAVSWFAGDNYKIIADKDCDVELMIAFCLIIDNFFTRNHSKNTVTYDHGNMGIFEAKMFDENWLPKY